MYCGYTVSRGDGEKTSQSGRRPWKSHLHGLYISRRSCLLAKYKPQEWDVRNTPSIEEAVRHSDVVYNLVGRRFPTKSASTEKDIGTGLMNLQEF